MSKSALMQSRREEWGRGWVRERLFVGGKRRQERKAVVAREGKN